MTTAEIQLVAQQYRQERDSLTEKEKAVRERALWAMADPETRKAEPRREFLRRILSEELYAIQLRHTILNGGDAADAVWRRIDDRQMTLKSASIIVLKARKAVDISQSKDMVAAISEQLSIYDALPVVRYLNGIPYRSGAIGKNVSKSTIPSPTSTPVPFVKLDQGRNREFWIQFRASLTDYLDKQCDGIDASSKELLKREFETDMKVLIDQFLATVRREQGKGKAQAELVATAISRNKVLAACGTLHMDPPRANCDVDMDKARRQKKLLARAYHPDSNGGDETTQGKYIAVIQAFQTLETYSEQFNAETHRAGNL